MSTVQTTVYKCDDCGAAADELSGTPLYECNECGTKFSKNIGMGKGHTCPECTNKFGSRIADNACEECDAGELVEEEIDQYHCDTCDEEFDDETEYNEHLLEAHMEEPT